MFSTPKSLEQSVQNTEGPHQPLGSFTIVQAISTHSFPRMQMGLEKEGACLSSWAISTATAIVGRVKVNLRLS